MKRKYFSASRLGLSLCLMIGLFSASAAWGIENHGQFSVEDYYYKDQSYGYKTHFLTTRLKLDTTKIDREGRYAFHFDGSDRQDLGSTGSTTAKKRRLNLLNLDYKGSRYYVAAGRLWPKELASELVDGVNVAYQFQPEYGMGAFAGFKPDIYTTGFSSKYTTGGLYGFYMKQSTSASLAYVYNGYKGGVDRQYLYGQTNVGVSSTLNVYGTATADISPSGKFSFTNGVIEANYRPDFKKGVFVGYNQFRTYMLYRSLTYTYDESRQHAYYVGGNYRLGERYNLYGRVERQFRHVPSAGSHSTINSYQAGLNVDNLMNTMVNMDLNINAYTGGGSRHRAYRVEFSRLSWEILQLMARASYTQNRYDLSDPDNILAYGFSAYLYYSRAWNFSFNFDREQGNTFTSNNMLSRLSYRF